MRLNISQINSILANWGIRARSFDWMEEGYVNFNWKIDSDKGTFVLRGTDTVDSDRLEFKQVYMRELKRKGFGYHIPQPILTKHHRLNTSFDNRLFWLYKYMHGEVRFDIGKKELGEVAKMIGAYHRIVPKLDLTESNKQQDDLDSFRSRTILWNASTHLLHISRKKRKQEHDRIFIEEVHTLLPLVRRLDFVGYNSLERYHLHRDITPGNVLWEDGKVVALLDFDQMFYKEVMIRDLTPMIYWTCVKKGLKKVIDFEMARTLLKEYSRRRKLSGEEVALIPYVLMSNMFEYFNFVYWALENSPTRDVRASDLGFLAKTIRWVYRNREDVAKKLEF
jgi:Ser/Thr protein kinase RdoA (MazF antagonist)